MRDFASRWRTMAVLTGAVTVIGLAVVATLLAPADPEARAQPFGEAAEFEDEAGSMGYALGYFVGQQQAELVEMGLVSPDQLVAGLSDALAGEEPAMGQQGLQQALMQLQTQAQALHEEQMAAAGAEQRQASEAALEAFAAEEGVERTESGLLYRVIEEGDGQRPGPGDEVSVHYEGTLVDGTVFDSSRERGQPARFPVDGVIAGWTEALQMMREGARYELLIPSELGYGQQGAGAQIPPGAALRFDVELLEVHGD